MNSRGIPPKKKFTSDPNNERLRRSYPLMVQSDAPHSSVADNRALHIAHVQNTKLEFLFFISPATDELCRLSAAAGFYDDT